jgi:hypothetical protein
MAALPDHDLFHPTLTADDDAREFHEPWNPWSLIALTFFCGLVAGGGLLAFNTERLGMRGRLFPTLLLAGAGAAAVGGASIWLLMHGMADWPRDTRSLARTGFKAAEVLMAMALAAPQHKRFRLYQATGRPPGKLWIPGLLATGVSLVFGLMVLSAGLFLAAVR